MIKCIKKVIKTNLSRNVFRTYIYETLTNRSVIEISGRDSKSFLQGLTSNDVHATQNHFNAVYSLFLNAKGRVLFDVIIYNNVDERILVECDRSICDLLIKHISIYKLRKKVEITKRDTAQVSVILPETEAEHIESMKIHETNSDLIYFGSDPRISGWLIRILSLSAMEVTSLVPTVTQAPMYSYLSSRLCQGVPEGRADFEPGAALPLEYNGDIMHAISFNKGCYVGQELTARTHHTGVVRKRVMPIRMRDYELPVHNQTLYVDREATIAAGVVKCVHEDGSGLGVIRLSSLDRVRREDDGRRYGPLFLLSKDGPVTSVMLHCPPWWPISVVLPGSVHVD